MVTNILSPVFKDVHGYNLKTLVVEEKKEETNTAAAAETSNTTATTKTEWRIISTELLGMRMEVNNLELSNVITIIEDMFGEYY